MLERRAFLKSTAAAALGVAAVGGLIGSVSAAEEQKWKKALKIGMLPRDLSDKEKFELAARCGYDGIDGSPIADLDQARRQADLAREAGCPIHGLVFGGWNTPLSSGDPATIRKGLEGMEAALRHAKAIDASTVLLVPAIVNEQVSYAQAYERSQANVRKLIPLAKELEVVIAIENVWNKFLLSPLEFARYLDELDSPWVKAYFDVGNVIIYGYSQHWIRTLGDRIVKIDLKDFQRQGYQWKNILDGDVNWKETRKALNEIGFEGFMTAELSGGDETYLTDVAERIDRFFKGDL